VFRGKGHFTLMPISWWTCTTFVGKSNLCCQWFAKKWFRNFKQLH